MKTTALTVSILSIGKPDKIHVAFLAASERFATPLRFCITLDGSLQLSPFCLIYSNLSIYFKRHKKRIFFSYYLFLN